MWSLCQMAAMRARMRPAMGLQTPAMVQPPCCWRVELAFEGAAVD